MQLNLPPQMNEDMYHATLQRAWIGAWMALVNSLEALQDKRVHEAVAHATAGNQILDLTSRLRHTTESNVLQ